MSVCTTCKIKLPNDFNFCSERCHDIFYLNESPLCIQCNINYKIMGLFCCLQCRNNHYENNSCIRKLPDTNPNIKKRKL